MTPYQLSHGEPPHYCNKSPKSDLPKVYPSYYRIYQGVSADKLVELAFNHCLNISKEKAIVTNLN